MYKNVYDCFKHWYQKGGSVYLYADPRFSDVNAYAERLGLEKSGENELSLNGQKVFTVSHLDERQVKNINMYCNGNDTLIILGEVGNLECVSKLKVANKVLILDKSVKDVDKYRRKFIKTTTYYNLNKDYFTEEQPYQNCDPANLEWKKTKKDYRTRVRMYKEDERCEHIESYVDNHLFDEVYEGDLQISPEVILSQKGINSPTFNVHGGDFELRDFKKYVLGVYDCDMDAKQMIQNYMQAIKDNKLNNINLVAELTTYKPISLKRIVESGMFKK